MSERYAAQPGTMEDFVLLARARPLPPLPKMTAPTPAPVPLPAGGKRRLSWRSTLAGLCQYWSLRLWEWGLRLRLKELQKGGS